MPHREHCIARGVARLIESDPDLFEKLIDDGPAQIDWADTYGAAATKNRPTISAVQLRFKDGRRFWLNVHEIKEE